jgi:hypothetical protein
MARIKTLEKIKYFANKKWQDGWFLAKKSGKCVIKKSKYNENTITVDSEHVKRVERLSDDEIIIQYGKDNVDELLLAIRKACKVLLPHFCNDKDIKKDNQEPHVILLNGAIDIVPTSIEVEALNCFKEVLGWSVTIWRNLPGTRYEPPDVSDSHVGNARNIPQTTKLAIDTMFALASNDYYDGWAEEEMFKEMHCAGGEI